MGLPEQDMEGWLTLIASGYYNQIYNSGLLNQTLRIVRLQYQVQVRGC